MNKKRIILITIFISIFFNCETSKPNPNRDIVSEITVFIPNYINYRSPRIWIIAKSNVEPNSYVVQFKNKDAMFLCVAKKGAGTKTTALEIYAVNGIAKSILKPRFGFKFEYTDKIDYLKAKKHLAKHGKKVEF